MAARPDKQNRKAALTAWKAQKSAAARAKFPLPREQLSAMFDWLDAELSRNECSHTLRLVRDWCSNAGVEARPIELWLNDNGGYCDCEALANAEQAFQEACKEPNG
ncbi:MAG: DUF2695 domain-containing protein [Gemmataceae bacterium]|nr:DUF2695 domain-containing protein [Gemmataceae bacterium]